MEDQSDNILGLVKLLQQYDKSSKGLEGEGDPFEAVKDLPKTIEDDFKPFSKKSHFRKFDREEDLEDYNILENQKLFKKFNDSKNQDNTQKNKYLRILNDLEDMDRFERFDPDTKDTVEKTQPIENSTKAYKQSLNGSIHNLSNNETNKQNISKNLIRLVKNALTDLQDKTQNIKKLQELVEALQDMLNRKEFEINNILKKYTLNTQLINELRAVNKANQIEAKRLTAKIDSDKLAMKDFQATKLEMERSNSQIQKDMIVLKEENEAFALFLEQKNQQVESLSTEIKNLNSELQKAKNLLKFKDQQINMLNDTISQKDHSLLSLNKELDISGKHKYKEKAEYYERLYKNVSAHNSYLNIELNKLIDKKKRKGPRVKFIDQLTLEEIEPNRFNMTFNHSLDEKRPLSAQNNSFPSNKTKTQIQCSKTGKNLKSVNFPIRNDSLLNKNHSIKNTQKIYSSNSKPIYAQKDNESIYKTPKSMLKISGSKKSELKKISRKFNTQDHESLSDSLSNLTSDVEQVEIDSDEPHKNKKKQIKIATPPENHATDDAEFVFNPKTKSHKEIPNYNKSHRPLLNYKSSNQTEKNPNKYKATDLTFPSDSEFFEKRVPKYRIENNRKKVVLDELSQIKSEPDVISTNISTKLHSRLNRKKDKHIFSDSNIEYEMVGKHKNNISERKNNEIKNIKNNSNTKDAHNNKHYPENKHQINIATTENQVREAGCSQNKEKTQGFCDDEVFYSQPDNSKALIEDFKSLKITETPKPSNDIQSNVQIELECAKNKEEIEKIKEHLQNMPNFTAMNEEREKIGFQVKYDQMSTQNQQTRPEIQYNIRSDIQNTTDSTNQILKSKNQQNSANSFLPYYNAPSVTQDATIQSQFYRPDDFHAHLPPYITTQIPTTQPNSAISEPKQSFPIQPNLNQPTQYSYGFSLNKLGNAQTAPITQTFANRQVIPFIETLNDKKNDIQPIQGGHFHKIDPMQQRVDTYFNPHGTTNIPTYPPIQQPFNTNSSHNTNPHHLTNLPIDNINNHYLLGSNKYPEHDPASINHVYNSNYEYNHNFKLENPQYLHNLHFNNMNLGNTKEITNIAANDQKHQAINVNEEQKFYSPINRNNRVNPIFHTNILDNQYVAEKRQTDSTKLREVDQIKILDQKQNNLENPEQVVNSLYARANNDVLFERFSDKNRNSENILMDKHFDIQDKEDTVYHSAIELTKSPEKPTKNMFSTLTNILGFKKPEIIEEKKINVVVNENTLNLDVDQIRSNIEESKQIQNILHHKPPQLKLQPLLNKKFAVKQNGSARKSEKLNDILKTTSTKTKVDPQNHIRITKREDQNSNKTVSTPKNAYLSPEMKNITFSDNYEKNDLQSNDLITKENKVNFFGNLDTNDITSGCDESTTSSMREMIYKTEALKNKFTNLQSQLAKLNSDNKAFDASSEPMLENTLIIAKNIDIDNDPDIF